ncbi:MAG: RNA polymerase sigma factor [Caldilineaceae bacterium]|nr:RNA polymerase sigma factor [Caldilineaceae bacterium]
MNAQNLPLSSSELYDACRSAELTVQSTGYQALWRYLYPFVFHMVRQQPDADDLAQDCAQQALVRIHQRLLECYEPNAFRGWARRIAGNLTIDELRRRRRLVPLPDEEEGGQAAPASAPYPMPDATALANLADEEIRALLTQAPLSERSQRAILGRYFDDIPDEALAQVESDLAGAPVLPSHIQVTRAKNLAKLRNWPPMRACLSTA